MLCLKANSNKLYNIGVGNLVSVSIITRANESRSFKIYEILAVLVIKEAKHLYINHDHLEVVLQLKYLK